RAAKPGTKVSGAVLARTETRTECSACGVETTVPFKPTQGRPVLCRQCFQIKQPVSAPLSAAEKAASELNAATAELMAGASKGDHAAVLVEMVARLPHA
ncbi:MAG: CxxC-x17-CxxC domain-containing protein, partial [Granulicella sp.]